jgi:hypothetical protein
MVKVQLDARGLPVSFEGPYYADRVNGRLTFRDWEHWQPEDQAEWRVEYEQYRQDRRDYAAALLHRESDQK